MNDKGFVTTTVAVTMMMICLAFLAVFYSTIQMRNVQIGLTEPAITTTVEERTATERLYGVFNADMLRTETIVFSDDIPISYTIDTLTYEYPERLVQLTKQLQTEDGVQNVGELRLLLEHLPHNERPTESQVIRLTIVDKEDN